MQWIKPLIVAILTFLAPIKGLILLLIFFITFDTLMAIYVAVKTKGWKSFTSALLRKGMTSKVILYLGTVILAYMVDVYIMEGTLFGINHLLCKGLYSIWIYAEVKSMDENSMKLGNKSFFIICKDFVQKISGYKEEVKKIID